MADGPTKGRWKVLEPGIDAEIYSLKLDLCGVTRVASIQFRLLWEIMAEISPQSIEAAKDQSVGRQDQPRLDQLSL